MSKVAIVKCENYEQRRVEAALFRAVGLIGGAERFIKNRDTVLLKPNLLSARPPEDAVCTHPEVVRAAVRLVKSAGARPVIGDSPAAFSDVKDVFEVYEKTGIKKIADEEGAELISFQRARMIGGYPIAECALSASLIISLPKLKTHALTVMTGAVKNVFGLVPGLFKAQCHKKHPRPRDFAKVIADVYAITRPRLSIMDCIVAMEGDGPSSGDPIGLGFLLAGSDGVSVDAVASRVVSVPFHKDIIINEAGRRGLGEADSAKIEVLGDEPETVRPKRFRLPQASGLINAMPGFLMAAASGVINFKPFIAEKLCKRCGICAGICPVGAIDAGKTAPRIDGKTCIRCFCCFEACPHKAILMKKNFAASLIWRD